MFHEILFIFVYTAVHNRVHIQYIAPNILGKKKTKTNADINEVLTIEHHHSMKYII